MPTIVEEIQRAVERLDLDSDAMTPLPRDESSRIYFAALNRFVGTNDRRWWWESFLEPGVSIAFASGDGWRKLPLIVPNSSERIWFVAEDDQLPQFPVFETSAQMAAQIIGECYGFEYYLIAKDFSWLVCETHHNVLCAVGQAVEERLLENAV